jgi:hypothetical protein
MSTPSIYLIYRLDAILVNGKPNGWFNYTPTDVFSSLENGYKIIEYVDMTRKEKGISDETMRDKTFIGTFEELANSVKWDSEKQQIKRQNGTYMPYEYFLCTTPLALDNTFPALKRDHSRTLYRGRNSLEHVVEII